MSASIAFHEWPLLVLATLLVIGALVGRFLCGWVCPMGFLQDLLYMMPKPKFSLPRRLSLVKYGVLALSVVFVAFFLGKGSPYFFCNLCPTAAIQVAIPEVIRHRLFSTTHLLNAKFIILIAVVVLAIGSSRSFCKILCPIGALIAITNRFSLLSIRIRNDTCVDCFACEKACPMDVPLVKTLESGRAVSRHLECIECMKCEEACPPGAISNNTRIISGQNC